jgi:hypothetical protein
MMTDSDLDRLASETMAQLRLQRARFTDRAAVRQWVAIRYPDLSTEQRNTLVQTIWAIAAPRGESV